ncbi:WYL domain-containing protein [Vibrio campbellii]|uniref:WYL domain-containing protein n=1 Tax=Vibrio campbellii TaxID=680 RepID=UPI0005AF0DE8|nr:WYL domain-containing protein [Vibrio campbellii]AUV85909.1 transcriptional regulator [Vibrio campbellii]
MNSLGMFNFDVEDQNIAERMAYIDFKLMFTGSINRSDLNRMFGLAEASASKMMAKYSSYRKSNMSYNPKLRFNEIVRNDFSPLVNLDAETALGMLANGFNRNKLYDTPELAYTRVGSVANHLDPENVAKITRAMSLGYAIECKYYSSTSDNHDTRVLFPLSLLFDGRNWIFRAFYQRENANGVFRNFNFSRACEIEECVDVKRTSQEELSSDREWNTQVPLMLIPHGRLSKLQKETLFADYGLTEDKRIITERAALLWYLFNLWAIDTRSESEYQSELEKYNQERQEIESGDRKIFSREYKHYNFRLANKDMVEAVRESFKLAL